MRRARSILNLLTLESRVTPAVSVNSSKGSLTITGDNNENTVFLSGNGSALKVYVVEGDNLLDEVIAAGGSPAAWEIPQYFRGTFNVTNSLNISMGKSDDLILVTLDDGSSLNADIDISTGPGSDNIQFQTRTNGKATLGGAVALSGGSGADDFVLFDLNLSKTLDISGDQPGLRTDSLLPGDVFIISDVNVADAVTVQQAITLIDSTYGVNTLGSLDVTNTTINDRGDYQLIDGTVFPADGGGPGKGRYNGLLVLDSGSTVLGDLTYHGSFDTDGVYIYGTVNGHVSVTNAGGNKHAAAEDDFFIGDFAGPGGHVPVAGTILGGVDYKGGTGADHIRLGAGTVIQGGATFDVGGGNNIYELDQLWSITGPLVITAGKGIDNVGTLGGSVTGDETFDLGDGDNTLRLAGTFTGNQTNYIGGKGLDSVTLAGAYKVFTGSFDDGADVFRYEAGSSLTSFFGNFGKDNDTDIYDDSLVVTTWPVTLVNYP